MKRNILNYYKKGQDINLLFVVVILLVIGIAIVIGFKVIKQFNSTFQTLDNIPQEAKDMTQKIEDKYVTWFDVLFLVILVFVFIIMVGSVFFIDTHPVFIVISILVFVVTGLVGGHIANAYSEFESNPSISADASQFKIIPYVFKHYITIIILMGAFTAIALYAKLKSEG